MNYKLRIGNFQFSIFNFQLICCLVFVLSCKSLDDEKIAQQEKNIESYIVSRMNADTSLRRSQFDGVNYLYRAGDTTVTRNIGDSIVFNYYGRIFSTGRDTVIFDTNIAYYALRMGVDTVGRSFAPVEAIAGNNTLLDGLSKGLMMTHPKDTGEIIFNSNFGFGSKPNGRIPSFSPLVYTVYVIK
jgi:hypothetical protein